MIGHHKVAGSPVVAGAGDVVLATSVVFQSMLSYPDCLGVHVQAEIENTSMLANATATLSIEQKSDDGPWAVLESRQIALRGIAVVGLPARDRSEPAFFGIAAYTGQDLGTVQVRLVCSCTGANVSVIRASMLVHRETVE